MIITVDKNAAMLRLASNRDAHVAIYATQMAGWKVAMAAYAAATKEWADAGGISKDRPREPPKPDSYESSYAAYLLKLDWHVPGNIELDDTEFDEVINNKFRWLHNFTSNSTLYGG